MRVDQPGGMTRTRRELNQAAKLSNRWGPSRKSAFPALQALLGLDIELGDWVYLSLLPRVIIASGQPFGLPQRYMDFAFTSLLGVRF